MPYYLVDDRVRLGPRQGQGRPDQLGRPSGTAQYKGHLGMLDDYQEFFAVAAFRLGFDANTTDEAQLDQIAGPARAAEAAAAQVHARTTSAT